MDKLGLPVEQFDDVLTSAKRPSAEHISKMNRMAKIAMEKSLAEKLPEYAKVAEEKLASDIPKNIAKAAPMETPYGKSFLSYTPEGKIAGKTGAALRGLGKLAAYLPYASGVGAAFTALDLGQALSEVQDKGAAKIAEDYKKEQENVAPSSKNSQYTPEERMKLREMLSKYRANAALRSEE